LALLSSQDRYFKKVIDRKRGGSYCYAVYGSVITELLQVTVIV
jgi:hypothetical protein